MDFWDVTKLLFRRWYIAVPLLLLTGAAATVVGFVVKPNYQLTSYVQLIPSSTTSTAQQIAVDPVNPWNQLGLDALTQAVDYAVVDQTFLDSLKAQGLTDDLTVTIGVPPAGATVLVIGSTREQVEQTTTLVMDRFDQTVKALQSAYGVVPHDMITTKRLDQGENLQQPTGKIKRAVVAVIGAGGLITGAACIIVDVMVMRRRRRTLASRDTQLGRATYPTSASENPAPAPRRPLRDLPPADRTVPTPRNSTASSGTASATQPSTSDSTMVMPLPDLDEWVTG